MRRIYVAVVLSLFVCSVGAQPNVPRIAESAANYRRTIEQLTVSLTATQILSGIQRARANQRPAELISFYEQLARLNGDNFGTWLQLGISWREVEPLAENGLSAAFIAHSIARSAPDRIEALLLMSWFLRTRLDQYRMDYEGARENLQKAERAIQKLTDPTQGDQTAAAVPNDPVGSLRLLTEARDVAMREIAQAFQHIDHATSSLDQVYRELATSLPVLDAERLKAADARSIVFGLVTRPGTTEPVVDFRLDGNDIRSCLEFTRDLHDSGLTYIQFIRVTRGPAVVSNVGISTSGRTLCLLGLAPAASYEVNLLAGLPSKEGAKLASAIKVEVRPPDRPRLVTFTGARHFVLPTSGPGQVQFSATNVDKFDIEIVRITDRTLHRQIALNYIGGELPKRELSEIRNRFAETLWIGGVQLTNAKKNETIKAYLPVRSLLDERLKWLQLQIAGRAPDQTEMVSPIFRLAAPNDPVRIEGQFYAGATTHEAATMDAAKPGVYGLITRDLSNRPNCSSDCDFFNVQWFLNTDIGLTFYEGDKDFIVVARSLRTGEAKVKARIELVAANNRVLATGETDKHGVITFSRNLTRGTQSNALVAILAHHELDFGFMTYGSERLDLSRLNVDGRSLTRGLSAFLTTDRGIYQPGEKINLLAFIRDANGQAPEPVPAMNVRLEARDRAVASRHLAAQDWKLGGALVPIPIPDTMRQGAARITLSIGSGDEAVIGEALIHVGHVRPDRAELSFDDVQSGWQVRKTTAGTVSIDGRISARYLFASGNRQGIARDLKAEVLVRVATAESPARACYESFSFGKYDDRSVPVSARHFIQYTDRDGRRDLKLAGIPYPEGTTKPMASTVEVTLFDSAGPLASRSMSFPVTEGVGWVGISKRPKLLPGSRSGTFNLGVELISIAPDNKPDADRQFDFRIERERDSYVWQLRDGTWQHVKAVNHDKITEGRFRTDGLNRFPTGPASAGCAPAIEVSNLATDLAVGRYVLTITDPQTRRVSSVRFYTGVTGTDADQLEPNLLILSTDKEQYRAGETIEFTAESPFDGEVLLAFSDGDVKEFAAGQARSGIAKIKFQVPDAWRGKGIYALATAFRSGTSGTFHAAPGRAIGAAHFKVSGDQSGYSVAIRKLDEAADGQIFPDDPLSFEVCVTDSSGSCSANPPPDVYAAAFIVDDGLLSLTGHHDPAPPDPERHFHGRTRFGLRIMDNYNRLLLKEGGDRPGRLALSNYTSARIVSEADGPRQLQNGRTVFKIPKLKLQNSRASIYVVAWSKDYVAAKKDSVVVRNRVVAELDAPSFLLGSDRAVLPLRLENIEFGHQGDYVVRIASSGAVNGVALVGADGKSPPPQPTIEFRVPLRLNEPRMQYIAVDAARDRVGPATLNISLEAAGSPVALRAHRYEWAFDLRPPGLPSVETVSFPLGPQRTNLSRLVEGLIAGRYADDARITAKYSDSPRALLASHAGGAGEQTPAVLDYLVWRGTFLLYGTLVGGSEQQKRDEITRILAQILSLQLPDGSFLPYRTVGNYSPHEFDFMTGVYPTATVLDFLVLAKNAGYPVPDQAIRSARNLVVARLANQSTSGECPFQIPYALLVLIDSGQIDPNQYGRLTACEYNDLTARAAGAAVVAKYGFADDAKVMLANFQSASDPTALNELPDFRHAMILAFLAEARAPAQLMDAVAEVLLARVEKTPLSSAARAWVMRAMNKATPPASRLMPADLDIQGTPSAIQVGQNGVLEMPPILYRTMSSAPISVGLKRNVPARGSVTIEGRLINPADGQRLPAGSLKRRFFDPDTGQEIDLSSGTLQVGKRLVVVVEGQEEAVRQAVGDVQPDPFIGGEPVLLADLLPSAFQIVSTNVFGERDVPLRGALAQLVPRGLLRSVQTDVDRWVALIIPESLRPKPQPDGTSPSPEAQQPPPAADPPPDVDFRQGYVVRVNMAGDFTYPAISIEASTPPVQTLWAEQSSVAIKLDDKPAR
jgi:uncharacterized protein YfaS (alpha-2-macroglobulin family)